jgi:hypothetical protein
MLKHKSAYWAFKKKGISGLLVHLVTRVFGDAHFLRPASSIDFKATKMDQFQSLDELLYSLLPTVPKEEISATLAEAENFLKSHMAVPASNMEFPDRWNSGRHLQLLLYSFIRIARPETVVETGTANGASANAIAGALEANNFGTLFTFDIEISGAPLVSQELRGRIEFVRTDGSDVFLHDYMMQKMPSNGRSLFLHDADHSYFGQIKDYLVASELNFDYIFSDDVDTSLAFCDFANSDGKVFFDAPKFIGCYLNTKREV